MAITDKSLDSKITKDRISISYRSFLKILCKRDELLDVGRMFINMQFTLKGVVKINKDVEKMVKKESAVVLEATAKNITKGMEKLRVGLKRKQIEEKSGKNKKASTEAFTMVKNMNSYITQEMGYLGGDIRKRIEKNIKAKITTVGQNQFNKIKLMRSAFSTAPTITYDKKTWGNIAKNINDLAFATGNKTVEEYISLSATLKENILDYDKEVKKNLDNKPPGPNNKPPDPKEAKKTKEQEQRELRGTLVSYTKNINSFQKEINDAKVLTKATVEMKKQKEPDDRAKKLLKRMDDLISWHNKMDKEISINEKAANDTIKYLQNDDKKNVVSNASTFGDAAKTMKGMSSKTKVLAKLIQMDAKKNVKKT